MMRIWLYVFLLAIAGLLLYEGVWVGSLIVLIFGMFVAIVSEA